ncbi:hypothetical protein [Coleofasciculus sp. F4-SAH-05]|uniref:hypothetical protein n=1 Tax=Coleofasciculus sp. F4-SAH-05 TaxID=3069525 RepID=UPI0032F39537
MIVVIRHLSFVICHLSFVICHLSFVIRHSSFVIRHLSFVLCLMSSNPNYRTQAHLHPPKTYPPIHSTPLRSSA